MSESHRNPSLCAIRTHADVARLMGLSRQRVVQLEAQALRKLRASKVLRELIDIGQRVRRDDAR